MAKRGKIMEAAMDGQRLSGYRIIDCHAHLGFYGIFDIPYNDPEGMLPVMDRVGIERACISALVAMTNDYMYGNDLVADAIKRYPKRFIGYAVLDPNHHDGMETELKRCFDKLGMKAIKLHTDLHGYPIDGPNYSAVLRYANDRRLITLIHGVGNPETLEKLSLDYPNAKIIVAHGGGWDGRAPNKYLPVVKKRANVYLDSGAGSLCYLGGVEALVREVGTDKVLYGSDFPFGDALSEMGKIIYAKIADEEKEKILGLNLLRLLEETE